MSTSILSFGSWPSSITPELLTAHSVRLGGVAYAGAAPCWSEGRPSEGGRYALVCERDGKRFDLVDSRYNVRNRVHEYGGGAFHATAKAFFFSNDADGGVYRVGFSHNDLAPSEPVRLWEHEAMRFADFEPDDGRSRLLAVAEIEADPEPRNLIVSLPFAGGAPATLIEGDDFYSDPKLSPDGRRLAWLSWRHPNMPWDGTELWLAELAADGHLGERHRIAGGTAESVFQPRWSPDGCLHFVSDRSGWWNLYRFDGESVHHLWDARVEMGRPQWQFGMTTYGFEAPDRVLCAYCEAGTWQVARLHQGKAIKVPLPFTDIDAVAVHQGKALLLAGSPTVSESVIELDLETAEYRVLRASSPIEVDAGELSAPQSVVIDADSEQRSYGFYYPPRNAAYRAPGGERPPTLVLTHGGPTGATTTALRLAVQYWTNRGIAVLDVNYRGSVGYGRAYRERLNGQWGISDVEDCVRGAEHLAAEGLADGERLIIRGGSAGGYTTLAALTFHDTFKAGASHYGISDLEALVRDTHKFESRYLDTLVGPYPECESIYRQRSPLYHAERLSCPIIFLHGLEDKVVPVNQAEAMVAVMREQGIPVAFIGFPGEQHGFRQAATIQRALGAELFFYGKVLGFAPAGDPAPVEIYGLTE